MKSQISVLLTLLVLILIASCGKSNPASGNDEDPPGPPANPGIATKDIGPSGGSLTSKDGLLTLNIPAGALGQEESITIEKVTAEDLGSEFDDIGINSAYELGPDGLEFDIPVEIIVEENQTIKIGPDSLQLGSTLLLTSENGSTVWLDSLQTAADAVDNILTTSGLISHFSPLVLTDGPLTVRFGGIPDTVIAGPDIFTISVGGEVDMDLTNTELVFFSESPQLPLETNNENGRGRLEELVLLDGLLFTSTRYMCPTPGDGEYFGGVSIPSIENIPGFFVKLDKIITCIEPKTFNLEVAVAGEGTGSVITEPMGIDCPGDCEGSYSNGTDVILSAKAAEGSKFAGWDGDYGNNSAEDSVITLTMDQARTVTAFFSKESSAAGILLQLRALPVVMTALESVSSPAFILSTLIQNNQNSSYGSNSFTLAEDRVPVLVQGAEGFIVFDLVTNDVLLDFTNVIGNDTTFFGLRTPLGAVAVSRPDPGPMTASVIASYGLDSNNSKFGFSLYPWDKQESEYTRGPVSPYTPVIDAFPVGGESISDEVVIVREGNSGINFLRYSESGDAYGLRPRIETFGIYRYGSEPVVTAYGEEVEGALLVVNAIGDLYLEARNFLIPTVKIGNLGQRILRLRCDLPLCVATDFDGNALRFITWDGQTEPTIVGGSVGVGAGPVDPDLFTLPNGDIVVAVTGFNDNTISILRVAGNGAVLSNILYEAPEGCINPGHVILEENSDDANNPLVIGTCYESDNYFVNDLKNSGGLFNVIGGM